jgi:NMD protein affecting ribosome stability and mRNA decay
MSKRACSMCGEEISLLGGSGLCADCYRTLNWFSDRV